MDQQAFEHRPLAAFIPRRWRLPIGDPESRTDQREQHLVSRGHACCSCAAATAADLVFDLVVALFSSLLSFSNAGLPAPRPWTVRCIVLFARERSNRWRLRSFEIGR